jgi:dual-specificity kinase
MSTPTTAVATFPHYRPHHYPHPHPHPHPHSSYAHSHHQQPQQGHQPGVSANYRPAATGTANNNASASSNLTQSVLPAPWSTTAAVASPPAATVDSSSLASGANAGRSSYQQSSNTAYNSPPPPRPPPHGQQNRSQNSEQSKYAADAPSGQQASRENNNQEHAAESSSMAEPARKRRRSRGPDWQEFYRNGLPNEIIVIADDTPEPEANTSRKVTNGANTNTTAHAVNSAATNGTAARQQQSTKKRRRDDDPATASSGPGYHVQYVESHTNTPAGSTISSDRTNSALHTTAPTSLSSQSQYDDTQLPAKRKRTTRQQVANEAKRRDTDVLGNRCFTYKPPPYPPKKASEVHVRVVQDVSLSSSVDLS